MDNSKKRGRKPKTADYNSDFAVRLRQLVETTGDTHEKIAQAVGVSRQAFSKWYNGETAPEIVSASKLAQYFGVSLDYIAGIPDKKIKNSTVNAICDYLLLNDNVVECINNQPMLSDAINTTIECDEMILIAINEFLHPRPIEISEYEILSPAHPTTNRTSKSTLVSLRDIEETAMLMFITDRLKAARKAKEVSNYGKHTPPKE